MSSEAAVSESDLVPLACNKPFALALRIDWPLNPV